MRGNRQVCFFTDEDYRFYLDWLKEYAREFACPVHAYILMSNHIHLLLTPARDSSVGELMKRLGQPYVFTTSIAPIDAAGRFGRDGFVLASHRRATICSPVSATSN